MGEVIDARPDRFLREMREHGEWAKACENAGFTLYEMEQLCTENAQFDLTQVECQLEYSEELLTTKVEHVIAEADRQIALARTALAAHIAADRVTAMTSYRERHNRGDG